MTKKCIDITLAATKAPHKSIIGALSSSEAKKEMLMKSATTPLQVVVSNGNQQPPMNDLATNELMERLIFWKMDGWRNYQDYGC